VIAAAGRCIASDVITKNPKKRMAGRPLRNADERSSDGSREINGNNGAACNMRKLLPAVWQTANVIVKILVAFVMLMPVIRFIKKSLARRRGGKNV